MIVISSKKIIVCAGGTGGHVIPTIVVINELKLNNHFVRLITDHRGYQYSQDFPLSETLLLDLSNSPTLFIAKIKFFVKIISAVKNCMDFIKHFKPDVIIGFGGYPSLPALIGARLLNIPIVIHEQNSVLGRVNKLFKSCAQRLLKSFPITQGVQNNQGDLIGMPIRYSNKVRGLHFLKGGSFTITIIGGSQGAKYLGTIIPNTIKLLPAHLYSQISIIHQVHPAELDTVKALYSNNTNVRIASFFEDMDQILSQSNLVIARAGASTVFETIALMAPVIYIPFPGAMDNHQYKNAEQFRQYGSNWIMSQSHLTPQKLANFIECSIKNPHLLLPALLGLKKLQRINVAQDLAKKIFAV